jgi:GT2 family glycosyltransferase
MNKPLVSVIVLNWNGKCFLKKCLGSLVNQDYCNLEILFVDNGSSDDSVEFVRNNFGKDHKLRIVALEENYGFSKGNNLGIRHARGDYVIILNNDTEVKPNFVKELVKIAESDDKIGSVSCKILWQERKTWFSQKFTNGGFIVPFFLQTVIEKHIDAISAVPSTNLANSGCAVLYKKDVLNIVGGFDAEYWSNFEDWDLGYRINLAGFKSVYIPKPLVFHVGAGSEGFTPERKVKCYRNMLFTYFKNYESNNLLLRFPIIIYLIVPLWHLSWFCHRSASSCLDFDKKRSLDSFLSIMRAYMQFLLNLNVFVKKRYKVQKLRKVSDKQIFSNTRLKLLL